MTPGEKLAVLRRMRGLTIWQLSQKTGVSEYCVNRYERNESNMPENNAELLAQALGVYKDDIIGDNSGVFNALKPDERLVKFCDDKFGRISFQVYPALAAIDTAIIVPSKRSATKFVPPFTRQSMKSSLFLEMDWLLTLAIFHLVIQDNPDLPTENAAITAIALQKEPHIAKETAIRICEYYRNFFGLRQGLTENQINEKPENLK